jgi:integrase/recombinase XerD
MVDINSELAKYLKQCKIQRRLDEKTLKAYSIDLAQFNQYLAMRDCMTKLVITEYIEHLHMSFSSRTVKRKIASIKAFYNYMVFEEIISENPFNKINTKFQEPQVLPRVIPLILIKKILIVAYKRLTYAKTEYASRVAQRDIAIVELLFATGLRVSELCSLNSDNVNLNDGSILIMGKGEKERLIQVGNHEVLTALRDYKTAYKTLADKSEYFFINRLNTKLSDQSIRFLIKSLCIQAYISLHITPHMFRHSFATLLLEENVDIRYIQGMLGHGSIKTTQIYTQVTARKQRQILTLKHPRNKMMLNDKK